MIEGRVNDGNIVDSIIEEFLQRKRSGDRPTIAEYCAQYPGLRDEIRELLRTVEFADDPACMVLLYLQKRDAKRDTK